MTAAVRTARSKEQTGEEALAQAVEAGEVTRVQALLNAGADPNTSSRTGMTVLMRAVAERKVAIVILLLDYGADVNARRSDGFTALLFAVFFGFPELVRLLLSKGADAEAEGRFGTSEIWAKARGFSEIAGLLKEARLRQSGRSSASLTPDSGDAPDQILTDRARAVSSCAAFNPADVQTKASSLKAAAQQETKNFPQERSRELEDPIVRRLDGMAERAAATSNLRLLPRSLSKPIQLAGVIAVAILMCGVAIFGVLKISEKQPVENPSLSSENTGSGRVAGRPLDSATTAYDAKVSFYSQAPRPQASVDGRNRAGEKSSPNNVAARGEVGASLKSFTGQKSTGGVLEPTKNYRDRTAAHANRVGNNSDLRDGAKVVTRSAPAAFSTGNPESEALPPKKERIASERAGESEASATQATLTRRRRVGAEPSRRDDQAPSDASSAPASSDRPQKLIQWP